MDDGDPRRGTPIAYQTLFELVLVLCGNYEESAAKKRPSFKLALRLLGVQLFGFLMEHRQNLPMGGERPERLPCFHLHHAHSNAPVDDGLWLEDDPFSTFASNTSPTETPICSLTRLGDYHLQFILEGDDRHMNWWMVELLSSR